MKHFFTPGGCHEYVKGFCTLAHGPLVGLCVCTSRIGSLLNLIPLYTFVSEKVISVSYILAVNLIVLSLFHHFSSLFCLGSIGKTHRQYIFSKTAVQLAWVPRDFLCAVSDLVKPFKVTLVKSFFSRRLASRDFCLRPKICWPAATSKHPAAPEKNPLVTRVRFNTTLSQYLVFYSGH